MDAIDLQLKIEYLGHCGIVLTPEQKSALQTSLVILKHEQKFQTVQFWGKIIGARADYFIAQGIGDDCLKDKRMLYSKDCIVWGLLPIPSPEEIEKSSYFKGRFTGDPAFEFEFTDIKQVAGEGDELIETEEIISMKEENRLAAVIARIDYDAQIIPRGAYIRVATGRVLRNKSFEGLTVAEAGKLSSYLHMRDPRRLPYVRINNPRVRTDKAIDFLDCVEDDIPKGCWAIQFEGGNNLAFVKSLLWMGFVLYHVPETNWYGSVYSGTGEYNIDLPFML
ncbi:Radial spoke head protein 9 [Cichlidogyrus casuarinus]|uniref:Radial spoke head protein 9 homolog n=1 Tax=Cichlidogyrus casuarinus TaxID=1844966 RepID=A0ABD2QNZ6_9PLAT